MGRDKLLKVDDSVSFRAINKIIRFTVLHDRQFTSSERGVQNVPFTSKHSPQADNAIHSQFVRQEGKTPNKT